MSLYLNRTLLLLFSGWLLGLSLCAQEPVKVERSNNKVILGGKVYYVHVVKPGETLYAISRAYNVSQKEISIENPGAISGIQVGQALKIPVEPSLEVEVDTTEPADSGGTFTIHIVHKGETLYGISRLYNLDEVQLLAANKGVTKDNLQPGQSLRIPEPEERKDVPAYNEEGFIYHEVTRRETLYSIARYYHVTVKDIRKANPELGWGGPKSGQLIRIPQPQVTDKPEAVTDTLKADTMALPATDSLYAAYNYPELDNAYGELRRTYRVACFVPFDFHKPEPLDSLIKDVQSVSRRNRIIEQYRIAQRIPQSVNFLEYFQGMLLAIDSLQRAGMKMDIRFYDTRKSMDRMFSILSENPELEDFDLFIGPFYAFNLEIVSAFAEKNRILVVTPFNNELELLQKNPYLFQLTPSLESEYREAAKLVASKYNYNIVYVRDEDSLNIEKHDYFKQLIFDGFEAYMPEEPVIFKEVVQKLSHTNEIIHSLSADKKNLVIVPTRNEALASGVVSSLYFQRKEFDIEVLGAPFWPQFSSINFRYYHGLNLTFYNSFWVDYLDPSIDDFMRKFREQYNSEPVNTTRRGINYGLIGYDAAFYFLNALRLYGPRFIRSLDTYRPGMVQAPFQFRRVAPSGGYENVNIIFYRFSPDMTINKIEVPGLPVRTNFFRPIEDRSRKQHMIFDRNVN